VENPVTINIAAGTYDISAETFPLVMESHVSLQGEDPETTIINAFESDASVILCKGEQANNLSIKNLTIRNGSGYKEENEYRYGGGICIRDNASNITIENCKFLLNAKQFASDCIEGGGGISINSCHGIKIDNCIIFKNQAFQGAGVYAIDSTIEVLNSTFTDNFAYMLYVGGGGGGGIYLKNTDSGTISNCDFTDNRAFMSAGGSIACREADLNMDSCEMIDNMGSSNIYFYSEDRVHSISVTNCKILADYNGVNGEYYSGISVYGFESGLINNNEFSGYPNSIKNYTDKCINAEYNDWGDVNGPQTPNGNMCGCLPVEGSVGGAVDEWVDYCEGQAVPTPTPVPGQVDLTLYLDKVNDGWYGYSSTMELRFDLMTSTEDIYADIYWVLIYEFEKEIFWAPLWTMDVGPALGNILIPANTRVEYFKLIDDPLPLNKPPINRSGSYTFVMVATETGTTNVISNVEAKEFSLW